MQNSPHQKAVFGVQVMIVCLEIPVPIQIQFKGTRVYVEKGQH
jgi:hypothetical protein